MEKPTVFVVSDDVAVRDSVKELVESAGLLAETFPSLQGFLEVEEPVSQGCLVFDAHSGDLSNAEQQALLAAACTGRPVLLLTERGDVPMAVCALKAGAQDVIQKPYRDNNLLDHIEKALEINAAAHG